MMGYQVHGVKSLAHQVMQTRKRRELAYSLYVEEVEVPEDVPSDSEQSCWHKLFTYLLALAYVGVQMIPGVVPAAGKDLGVSVQTPYKCHLM